MIKDEIDNYDNKEFVVIIKIGRRGWIEQNDCIIETVLGFE